MNALYVCYQSISEPLTQTQVVAYLEGIAMAGNGIVLLTFEPTALTSEETIRWRGLLRQKGITWYWIRYHKRPTAPATAWDICAGVFCGLRLIRRHSVSMVHARVHVPGVIGLILKRLTGVKLLFDIRGFIAEEYVDNGNWPAGGILFRTTKRIERRLVRAADGIVVLTNRARVFLQESYPAESAGKPIEVIPCCVDLRHIEQCPPRPESSSAPDSAFTITYVGKLGGWYLSKEMAAFIAAAARLCPEVRWEVWTQSDPCLLRPHLDSMNINDRVSIGRLPHDQVLSRTAQADAAIAFYKPGFSTIGCSPTKVGEYLAAGLPVLATAGIGDLDGVLQGRSGMGAVGCTISSFDDETYSAMFGKLRDLLAESGIRERCRASARQHFDLHTVGWPRYQSLYGEILLS